MTSPNTMSSNMFQMQVEAVNEDSNSYNVMPHSHSQKKVKKWRNRICLGVIITIGISLLSWIAIGIYQKPYYVVIIDAGSTGSRVHVFSFHKSIPSGNPILDDELYARTNPGLSSYADTPAEGAKSLQVLLEKARAHIPQSEWHRTPLSLKATAGLRLLSHEKATKLLEECEKLFQNSSFLISNDSVSIMAGADEGIFSWLTVNFFLDRLTTKSPENTVATLDLGGGSVQVTFVPDAEHAKDKERDIFTVNAFGNDMTIYTHSYLGMGLMAARKGILTYGQDINDKEKGSQESLINLHSECINPIISTKWSYGGVNYLIKGPINVEEQNSTGVVGVSPSLRFYKCLEIVKNFVTTMENKPLGLENQEIVATSTFFTIAEKLGRVNSSNGGIVTVNTYLEEAMVHCDDLYIKYPFLCLDLTFVYVLLTDGFNLQPTTECQVREKFDNYELSWALGAAFEVLRNQL